MLISIELFWSTHSRFECIRIIMRYIYSSVMYTINLHIHFFIFTFIFKKRDKKRKFQNCIYQKITKLKTKNYLKLYLKIDKYLNESFDVSTMTIRKKILFEKILVFNEGSWATLFHAIINVGLFGRLSNQINKIK